MDIAGDPAGENLLEEIEGKSLWGLASGHDSDWDMASLTEKIKLSQKRRLYLRQVLRMGETADWDYAAPDQMVQHCLRGEKVYNRWACDDVYGFKTPSEDN